MNISNKLFYLFLAFFLATICIVFQYGFEDGINQLRYYRPGISDGEAWRLISGHFVHLNTAHLLLNLSGLMLTLFVFQQELSPQHLLAAIIFFPIVISAGLWLLNPHIQWYVGLSGVLHGLLLLGALLAMREQRVFAIAASTAIITKLAFEQFNGGSVMSEQLIAGNVVVESHLYGAVSGIFLALILLWLRKRA